MFVRQMVTPIIAIKNDPNTSIRSYVNNTLIIIHNLNFVIKKELKACALLWLKKMFIIVSKKSKLLQKIFP